MSTLHRMNHLAFVPLALVLVVSGCMKAERLGTDSNSPEGFVLGEGALGFLAGASAGEPVAPGTVSTVATGLAYSPRQMAFDSSGNLYVNTEGGLYKVNVSQNPPAATPMPLGSAGRGLVIDTSSSPNVIYTAGGSVHKDNTPITVITAASASQSLAFSSGPTKRLFVVSSLAGTSTMQAYDPSYNSLNGISHQPSRLVSGIAYSSSDGYAYYTDNWPPPSAVYRWNTNATNPTKELVAGGSLSSAGPSGPDGVGSAAFFESPEGIAVDSVGSIYVAEYGGARIRKIRRDAAGAWTVKTIYTFQQGWGAGLALDAAGNLYAGQAGDPLNGLPHGIIKVAGAISL